MFSKVDLTILVIAVLWIGMLLGVSFLATPVKFLAPTLTLPVALDVGRQTFAIFSKVESVFALLLVLLVFLKSRTAVSVSMTILVALIVLFEVLWLLPVLDMRVGNILAGHAVEQTNDHRIYITLDVLKLLALSVLSAHMIKKIFQNA